MLLYLCSESLLGMGTKDMDFVELSQVIGRKTGGISVSACVSSVHGKKEALTYLMIQSKGMANQIADVLNLVYFQLLRIYHPNTALFVLWQYSDSKYYLA